MHMFLDETEFLLISSAFWPGEKSLIAQVYPAQRCMAEGVNPGLFLSSYVPLLHTRPQQKEHILICIKK